MIATFDAVSDLLAEAGAVLDVDGIAAYEEERSWIVAVAEEGNEAITIDYEEDFAKLFITAALGTPPAAKRAATHTFMLEYNAMWTDTGGVRLGLSPESGDILLIHDLPLAGLTPEILHRTLSTFI
ncbi:MAG: type III secretion system chaperone, partial [Pseudomonadota bacterium]